MNYAMITNHAHAHTHTYPPPLGEPESKKIGFVAPIVASAEISKTINMHGTTNVIIQYNQCHSTIKMKWYKH